MLITNIQKLSHVEKGSLLRNEKKGKREQIKIKSKEYEAICTRKQFF